ncbi:DUF4097 family beta strand repeat-containing protein [Kribbella soli]|uniref:DUF4097 domain-containing protein n=1 Tax=Kribbella soli TaxID=1124743 RepID=A0A4V2M020_9ACTN|nr:DUF4097 family beta strand repeat-containing protein [Kribbella soli]TCC10286.1 hypothetical protein E0H45_02875 [Kribbella soli]
MSESSQETGGLRARASRWNAARRGRKTLKAAYTQAARDVKRMDPAVRERIGRANMTKSDLQQLASLHVDATVRPGPYGDLSQRLGQAASARLEAAGPAPRQPRISSPRNPLRRVVNRYSRWGRNERQGTKVLKAALKQAARDVKRTDPAVQVAIGRSTLNSADLAALASGRMDQVFRPEGRLHGMPGQQNGAGRQGQGIQSRDAVRQAPSPQQSEQMALRIAALQQSILESQQQTLTLMQENNRLQAEMRQLLEARVQELQQENTNPALEPSQDQQREGDNQLEAGNDQEPGERTEGEAEARTEGEPRAEGKAEVGEGEPQAVGEQAETGDRPASEAQVGDDNGPQLGEGGEPQTPQAGPEVEGAEGQNPSEAWTVSSETQGESVRTAEAQEGLQPTGELDAPAASSQDPASTPAPTVDPQQLPGTDPQQPGVTPQGPGVNGQPPRGADPREAAADAQGLQEPAAGETPRSTPSTRRELVADTAGPVTIDAELMRSAGNVTVRVDPNCTQARLEISTTDTEGPSAEAVQRATLGQSPDGVLSAKVAGTSNGAVISTGHNGIQISGYSGSIMVNGTQINGNGSNLTVGPAPSPIEVTAVVPPGSALSARTQSADIEARGLDTVDAQTQSGDVNVDVARTVSADTQSGDVSVGRVQDLDARAQSGDVSVGRAEGEVRAKTQSGNVSVDRFAGGTARVGSMSGNARIHVVDQAANGPRIVRADSISGNATISTSSEGVAQNLNADATSLTGRASAPPRASTAPLHQSGQSGQSSQGARPDHQMPGRQSPTARGPASEK